MSAMDTTSFVLTTFNNGESRIVGVVMNDRARAIECCAELNAAGRGVHNVVEYPNDTMLYDVGSDSGSLQETFARKYSTWDGYEACLVDEAARGAVREEKLLAAANENFLAVIKAGFAAERKKLQEQEHSEWARINMENHEAQQVIQSSTREKLREAAAISKSAHADVDAREAAAVAEALAERGQ